jgi:hypothetical protein
MLIVSKYHDYYDTAHNGFIDKSIVFQRNQSETTDYLKDRFGYFKDIKGKKIDIEFPFVGGTSSIKGEWEDTKQLFAVGFCGKFYIGLYHFREEFSHVTGYNEIVNDDYIYSLDEMIKCLELKPEKKSKPYSNKYYFFSNYYNQLIDFYNKYNDVERPELFLKYRAPIIYIGNDPKILDGGNRKQYKKIILNPILNAIEFYKVFDSKSAFDSISMFISNVLTNPEKEPLPIPNKNLIESKGFDYKTSFRKDPAKQRTWRKRRVKK